MQKFKLPHKKNKEEDTFPQNISRIGSSLLFKGDLEGDEDVVVEGKLKGKVELRNNKLTVESGGKIEAEIHVKNITINGEVEGDIHASEKVFVSKNGHIKGNITAPRISIDDGAQFKGSVKMNEDVEKESPSQEKITSLYDRNKKREITFSSPEEPSE